MTLPDLSSTPKEGEPCALCKKPSKHQCGACEAAAYCSGEHQKEHWSQHKEKCKSYKVLKNDKLGRYAVASRTLEAGEQVLTELPVVVGPKPDTYVMCLGCYAPVDGSVMCSRCSWPVCSPECEAAVCHAKAECEVFRAAGARFQAVENCMDVCPQLNCIAPLRLLLAKESNPERWESEVKLMEAHNDDRRDSPIWENNQINVVDYLRKVCKLADRFDEELIHTACGILEVNSFEVRCPNGSAVQGLYPQTAILSHSCVPNTSHCIINVEDNRLILRTTVKVERGTELHTTYTHTLNPTLLRREHLKQCKYFDCSCARCADPTELGTHMSSLKCNKCDPGLILSSNPLDPMAQWKCTHCEFCTPGLAVRRVFSVIQNDLDQLEYLEPNGEAVEQREALWKKYRSVLHPKNAFLILLRCSLSQLYGRAEGYTMEDLPDILLERKVELCKDILSVADVIEPGLSRLRGMTLYELHAPVMLFARSQWRYKEIDDKKLRVRLEEAEKYLKEAVDILKHEHPSTPEGMISAVGEQSIQQLRESIETLPSS
ncbi:SET domain-containing protein SmydA-8 [Periplaneta americana]|uniref:SET domain-containing protein SmydA-8 n=1 Tax=Periplaneta americana TaxID=6978 RepID=UPI0037E7D005